MDKNKIKKITIDYLHLLSWSLLLYIMVCALYNGLFVEGMGFDTTVHFNRFGEFWFEVIFIPFMVFLTLTIFILDLIEKKEVNKNG